MTNQIKLIVGLGNPGSEYQNTRHNVGFWLLDKIADFYNVNYALETKFFAEHAKIKLDHIDIHLLKPQTFMNLSGKSVLTVASFYKIPIENIIVAHDELDFSAGVIKIKQGGGNGGHNGLKDIDRCVGNKYWRLRYGIGHPGDKRKVASYVLNPPSLDEKIAIELAIDKTINVMNRLLIGEYNVVMKYLHTMVN